jgi:hypothetical protein
VTISGPQGLAAAVPFLVGFQPSESLVLLCMQQPRHTLGPTIRIDLPLDPEDANTIAAFVGQQGARHADEAALFCFTSAPDEADREDVSFPHAEFMARCVSKLREVGVEVFDSILVRDELVWSYLRHEPSDAGYPLPEPDDEVLGGLQAEHVGSGRAVLADRSAVLASVQEPSPDDRPARFRDVLRARERFLQRTAELTYQQSVALGCKLADDGLEALSWAQRKRRRLPNAGIAELAALSGDQHIRDNIISWALTHIEDEVVPLFTDVVRRIPDPDAAPLCLALAIAAYRSGDGALANAAVERALRADPDLRLARMLVELLSTGIRPEQLDILILDWSDHPANPAAECWQRESDPR